MRETPDAWIERHERQETDNRPNHEELEEQEQDPDEDNFPVPVLAEPKDLRIATFRPRQALESTDERPSNSESHPVLHAVNSRDSGDSSGGEVSLYSLPKPPEPLPFWMWPQPKQLTDQSPFQ